MLRSFVPFSLIMTFEESLHYLLSLGNEVSTMKLGLENIQKLLTALENPHQNYLKVQVAGTNGKGSVCAFLDAICISAGIRTGLYTSPHLLSITERIKIGGREISEVDFAVHSTKVRQTAERLLATGDLESTPTFFEQVSAIALNVFAEEKVELAILETGLGGRFDATTAANAEIAVITRIDLDHQEYLGETLAEIAAEKAAIIRPDSTVIVGSQKTEVERVIRGRCRELGIEPHLATTKIVTKKYDYDPSYPFQGSSFRTERGNYPNIILGLLGKHQEENASTAIAIVEMLRELGFKMSDEEVWAGLESAQHRGRLEYIDNFLFDGAHNIGGAKALREYLDEFVTQSIIMIFGAMRDKDLAQMSDVLFPKADRLILTTADNSRAMAATELLDFIPAGIDRKNVFLAGNVEDALKKACELSSDDGLICVTGSLYLVGEAQKILSSEFKL